MEDEARAEVRICPSCGAENGPQARFCRTCGGELRPQPGGCPACGESIHAGAQFCRACGAALAQAAAPLAGRTGQGFLESLPVPPWATVVAAAVAAGAIIAIGAFMLGSGKGGREALPVLPAEPSTLPGFAEMDPILVPFDEGSVVLGQPLSVVAGPQGGTVQIGDAALTIAQGSFSADARLTVAVVEYPATTPEWGSTAGMIYLVGSDADVPVIDPPMTLRLPVDELSYVIAGADGEWALVGEAAGPTAQVAITHLSWTMITALPAAAEWVVEAGFRWWWKDGFQQEQEHRARVAQRGVWTQSFYGLNEGPGRDQDEMCDEIRGVFATFASDPANWTVPEDYTYSNLGLFLIDAAPPSETFGLGFWERVEPSMSRIRDRVLGGSLPAEAPATNTVTSEQQLSPADILKIAIEENGGNVPLGVLAAHNFLKELAYQGRRQGDPNHIGGVETKNRDGEVSWDVGYQVAHIEPWRNESRWNAGGRIDKMGPIYHMFASMTAGVWGPGDLTADVVSVGEGLVYRTLSPLARFMGSTDVPDREKGEADECGAALAATVPAWKETAEAPDLPTPATLITPIPSPSPVATSAPTPSPAPTLTPTPQPTATPSPTPTPTVTPTTGALPNRSLAYDFALGDYAAHLGLSINFAAGTLSGTLSGSKSEILQGQCGQGDQLLETAQLLATSTFSSGLSGSIAATGGPFSAPVSIAGTTTYSLTKPFTLPQCVPLNAKIVPPASSFSGSGTVSGSALANTPTSVSVSTTLGSWSQ